MKKVILTLGLIAVLSASAVSCSSDDSALTTNNTTADDFSTGTGTDNGNKDLPKLPQRP